MTNPIYKPSGAALEYSPDALALNIYDSCPHGCAYCWARGMAKRFGKPWPDVTNPRPGIVAAVKRQLDKGQITGKLIHLCFTCDPYPTGCDTSATREIIKAIKDSGNHVQILTKGAGAERDFDLLDGNDWVGVTYAGYKNLLKVPANEPGSADPITRLALLDIANRRGIKTWVSCEPVLAPEEIYSLIRVADYIDLYRIGKLNYHKPEDYGFPSINWGEFGRECERLCQQYGRQYYIKAGLRAEMEAAT
jgi:DNA repair photolyase